MSWPKFKSQSFKGKCFKGNRGIWPCLVVAYPVRFRRSNTPVYGHIELELGLEVFPKFELKNT